MARNLRKIEAEGLDCPQSVISEWLESKPLGQLSARQETLVHRSSTVSHFEKGATIYREGDIRHCVYCVLSGLAIQKRSIPGGSEVAVNTATAGHILGLLSFESDRPYFLSTEALSKLQAIKIPLTTIRQLWQQNSELAYRVSRLLMGHLEDAYEALTQTGFSRVDQRILNTLINLSEPISRQGEIRQINFPITRREIAELSHTTVETAIRTLKRWEHSGWVRTERKRITLVCLDCLWADVQGDEHIPDHNQ